MGVSRGGHHFFPREPTLWLFRLTSRLWAGQKNHLGVGSKVKLVRSFGYSRFDFASNWAITSQGNPAQPDPLLSIAIPTLIHPKWREKTHPEKLKQRASQNREMAAVAIATVIYHRSSFRASSETKPKPLSSPAGNSNAKSLSFPTRFWPLFWPWEKVNS